MVATKFLIGAMLATAAAGCDAQGDDGGDFTTPGTVIAERGDGQEVPAGAPFPDPLFVVVFTPGGNKCNGCFVEWTLSPEGFDSPVESSTEVTGEAGIMVNSLSPAGIYTITATIESGSQASFTLTAE